MISYPMPGHCEDKNCSELQQEMEQKKQRMSEFISALHTFNEREDVEILKAMNAKISQLANLMLKLEKEIADCEKQRPREVAQGMGVVKSDEGRYATVPCSELRKKVIILTQKAHSLRKRQHSMLSELDATERRELQEISQDLQAVRDAIKSRCTPPPAPKPFRRTPHSAGRN
jgi:hypothetical protein